MSTDGWALTLDLTHMDSQSELLTGNRISGVGTWQRRAQSRDAFERRFCSLVRSSPNASPGVELCCSSPMDALEGARLAPVVNRKRNDFSRRLTSYLHFFLRG